MMIHNNNQRQFKYSMKDWLLVLLLFQNCLSEAVNSEVDMKSICSDPQIHRFLDISNANIQKSKNLQFSIELYDTPIANIQRGEQGIVMKGNFSELVIRNIQTKKETIYQGRQLVVKSPPNHVFNLQKIPELQIQIHHIAVDLQKGNPIEFVMLSQLYVTSKFTKMIETVLSKHLALDIPEPNIFRTSQVIKILDGFPMLMYRGAVESYPCRTDLLVIVKKQYQLLGEEDMETVKQMLFSEAVQPKSIKKAFRRKNLYEVYPMKKRQKRKNSNDEL